jgi:hypothetical protein
MRMTQEIGLKEEAQDYLDKFGIREEKLCPTCSVGTIVSLKSEIYDDSRSSGMFDDGPLLAKYFMTNGLVLKEIVQCVPWSSGPMIFMCLENEKGERLFEWTTKEIDEMISGEKI